MTVNTMAGSNRYDLADAADLAILRTQKNKALRVFQVDDGNQAYTSPRLLQRFIACELDELRINIRCSSHEMLLVAPQTHADEDERFVSMVCGSCRHHFHVKANTKHGRLFDGDHPRHMLIPCDHKNNDELRSERSRYNDMNGYARFMCTADQCFFSIEIFTMPPKLSNDEVNMFTDEERLHQRLQSCLAEDPERYKDVTNKFLPAGTLHRYLSDAQDKTDHQLKIKKRNKRFKVSFGTDFDTLLRHLGFQEQEDETGEDCWLISRPEEEQGHTPVRTLRARMQDTQEELKLIIPEMQSTPAWEDLVNAFQGKYVPYRSEASAMTKPSEEDLALLGCLLDYQPNWYSWAAVHLAKLCPGRRDEYLDAALRCIRQRSEEASMEITIFRSQFDPTTNVNQTLQSAFSFFGAPPTGEKTAEFILNKYAGIIQDDPSDLTRARAVQHLEVIGNHLGRDLIRDINESGVDNIDTQLLASIAPGASGRRMSIASAARLLKIDADFTAELIRDFASRVDDTVPREKVCEALDVLSELKQQQNQPAESESLQQTIAFIRGMGSTGNTDTSIPSLVDDQLVPGPSVFMNTPPGLKNIGNTCYLNSLLQYFYNVKPIRDLVLNYSQIQLELDEEHVSKRRTGGNGTSVNLEEAIVARQFIEMLRCLFLELGTTTDAAAQPSQKLANTALSSAKEILSEPPQNKPPPLPARPSPAPPVPAKEDVNTVNVTVEPVHEHFETASSRSSQTLVDEKDDSQGEPLAHIQKVDEQSSTISILSEPNRAEIGADGRDSTNADICMEDRPVSPTLEGRMAQVSRRLEQSDRAGTSQQDVEEIIGNILEHLMRAIRSNGPMTAKPDLQADEITQVFFTMIVNCTVKTSLEKAAGASQLSGEEHIINEEVVPERWITAFPHPDKENKVQSTLYAALDRYFSYEQLSSGNLARFTTIRALPPILHICIQRSDASGVKNKNPVIIPEDLYLDRYMEAEAGSDLWKTRRRVWAIQERIRDLDQRLRNGPKTMFKEPDVWTQHNTHVVGDGDNKSEDELFKLDELLIKDIARHRKRKSSDALLDELSQQAHSKKRSPSPSAHDMDTDFVEMLMGAAQRFDEQDRSELYHLRQIEEESFADMKQQRYRLHAVICHGGGMNAGHYWVWVRDFQRNVWYKYNDSLVTEDTRESQQVLDELNQNGDPYYVAYVRDEMKNDIVEVPQRSWAGNSDAPSGDRDVDMLAIEGVTPERAQEPHASPNVVPDGQAKSALKDEAVVHSNTPYQMM
ncbi:hypothetical protein F5Y15DRAFT_326886 [Xylariaceae sp. FL0016]|nr:hypothetical protein F5Y15DRAFT_326886 [Xylariaceae sp. FL0016]